MLSWGSIFIAIVGIMIFGIGYYGYNSMEELAKANWLVVFSGLATLFGTFLSGVTAIYGFLNKREIEELKERVVAYDLENEVELAKELRAFLASQSEYILENIKKNKTTKDELDTKMYEIFIGFSKVKSISKMKKYKKLENKAKHHQIFNDLDKDYFFKIKKIKIPKKNNLHYLIEILVEIENFKRKKGE